MGCNKTDASNKRGKTAKGKRRSYLRAFFALVFLASVGMMVRQQMEYQKIAGDSAEAAQVGGMQKDSASRPLPSPGVPAEEHRAEKVPPELPESPLPEETAFLADLDLAALQAVNEDVMGWIAIPGTELSYPLMQGEDNQYYLSHNWKKEASGGGSVFLESTNSQDLTDFHTIVYAHRMRNDTMFGTLKYYEDPDFWLEHPSVYIVTGVRVYRYDIFAAQEASVKGIIYRLDIEQSCLEKEFLQYCTENSVIGTDIAPEISDRILTLSTCTENGHSSRWVVHAVLRQIWQTQG